MVTSSLSFLHIDAKTTGLLELSKSGIYGELSDKGSTAKFKLLGRLYGYSILYEITPLIPLSPPYLRMLRGSKTILQSDIHNVDRVQSIEGFKNHEWFGKVLYESYDSRSFKAFSEGFFKMVSKRGSFLSLGSVSRMDWRMLVDREVTVDVLENSAVYIGLGRDDVIVRWFWDWARSLRRLTILRKLLYYPAIPVGGIENARDWQGRTVGLKVMQSENSCANFITESNSVELPGTYTDFDDFSRALDMALKGEKIVLGRAGKISKCV